MINRKNDVKDLLQKQKNVQNNIHKKIDERDHKKYIVKTEDRKEPGSGNIRASRATPGVVRTNFTKGWFSSKVCVTEASSEGINITSSIVIPSPRSFIFFHKW